MNISDITYLQTKFAALNIKNFTGKEIVNGWDIPDELLNNIIPTIIILDKLREFYNKPIYILSTYRSPEYNKAVKGKSNSLHLVFNAIDFTIANHKDLLKLYNKLDEWDQTPNMFSFLPKKKGNFGLGLYPTFIHLDTRATLNRKSPARW